MSSTPTNSNSRAPQPVLVTASSTKAKRRRRLYLSSSDDEDDASATVHQDHAGTSEKTQDDASAPAPFEITAHHDHAGTSEKIRGEIKNCQSTPKFLIRQAPMLRLIKEVIEEVCTKNGEDNHFRMTKEAIDALQTAAEAEMVEKFVHAEAARAHRGKATLTTDDMRLVPFLLSHGQSDPPVFHAETKRVGKSIERRLKKTENLNVANDFEVQVEYQKPTLGGGSLKRQLGLPETKKPTRIDDGLRREDAVCSDEE